jgi:hypothetical protein
MPATRVKLAAAIMKLHSDVVKFHATEVKLSTVVVKLHTDVMKFHAPTLKLPSVALKFPTDAIMAQDMCIVSGDGWDAMLGNVTAPVGLEQTIIFTKLVGK